MNVYSGNSALDFVLDFVGGLEPLSETTLNYYALYMCVTCAQRFSFETSAAVCRRIFSHDNIKGKERKGRVYSAIYYACIVSKCSDMDHTVLLANYTMPAFL